MADPLFKLEQVTKTYRSPGSPPTEVLKGVSLELEAGQLAAITGPSGSGKSTLMHILGFLHPPSSGRYFFEGREVGTMGRREVDRLRNSRIGFVFQDFCLLDNLSVLDNVALPLVYAGRPRQRRREQARQALVRMGLEHRLDYDVRLLSGGEKQRVAVARALVTRPAVILADEPTGNLDQDNGQRIIELFDQLNQEGLTVVLVTHEPRLAAHCPVNFRLADGRLVEAA